MIVEFWIRSSRGTDEKKRVSIRKGVNLDWVLEQWAREFGACHVSDNYCEYGWRRVRKLHPKSVKRKRKVKV